MNQQDQQSNHEKNMQATQPKNFLALILIVASTVVLILLLAFDLVIYLVKGDLPKLFEYLTVLVLGNFMGAFMSAVAFYFGEPKSTISRSELRKILDAGDGK